MEAVRFITGLWRTRMTDNIGLNLITLFIISAIWMWGIVFEGIK